MAILDLDYHHGTQQLLYERDDVVIVSLGVDTFEGDPIGGFKRQAEDFIDYGWRLAAGGWRA